MTARNPASRHRAPSSNLIASDLLLSLATVPLLVGLVAQKAITEAIQDLGLLSEEIFRGDRLPILNFPTSEPDSGENK